MGFNKTGVCEILESGRYWILCYTKFYRVLNLQGQEFQQNCGSWDMWLVGYYGSKDN